MNNITLKAWNTETSIIDLIQDVAQLLSQHNLYYGHGTDNPTDEAAALVFFALGLDHFNPKKSYDLKVQSKDFEFVNELVTQRIKEKKPLAYITNESIFCGHKFVVDERVLIPRSPIAELIQNRFEPWIDQSLITSVLDIATGSGCLAISIAKQYPNAEIVASDISKAALEVAEMNVDHLLVDDQVTLVESDLFENIKGTFDLIVSNPPYVSHESMVNLAPEYHHEPSLALAAEKDGLDFIERILHYASPFLKDHGILVIEMGEAAEAAESYFTLPLTWIELENGGEGIAMIEAKHLK